MAGAVRAAHVEVDCRRWEGSLRRIWTSFGYDELNWTATPRGKQNLATLHAFMEVPYTVRAHNLYTSGTGRGLPHWSSGNVYHEDAAGRPVYDWTLVDPVFDAWVHHGCRPIVELGFCPRALVSESATLPFTSMPSVYSACQGPPAKAGGLCSLLPHTLVGAQHNRRPDSGG